ncbi:protein S-acyltransferase 10-like isoform X2 [Magnolia sinica]|uniref:protein S-acyltransferase 10-like isoform X2 n=1 Tax=Magnolia sinica TaxID=86752 RepID=UPI0026591E99|nr:protein S-acyltransferase 10-like isoform X2 [Magnolia sinica]
MTIASFCRPVRDAWVWSIESCFQLFPCLADPAKRSSWGLKLALLVLHLIFVGVLFLFDRYLIQKTKKEPWYIAIYLALFLATLFQYFFTSSSSPGYVLDAMRAGNETHSTFSRTSATSKQPALRKNGSLNSPVDGRQLGRDVPGVNTTSWDKLVMEMYPLGSSSRNWTCTYCNVAQPPRSKHCHDCDKCVLQFDHHCVWLGTCIGQGNHCRFWWYIFEETILCIWTGIFYITFLKANITRQCYLVLTNQTTYELVRRRRISYLRSIPERVYPFSKGMCRNLYNFCCARSSIYAMEPLPTADELDVKARPYTCVDVFSCRCC